MIELPAPALPSWIARRFPPGVRRYRVDIGGLAMHVVERGQGRPVLLLHGNPTWSFLWRKVAALLPPDRFRVIMPDLVGLGLSDKPRAMEAHTLAAHAGWMGALVDRLALDDMIVGVQDWGGAIGFAAMAEGDRARRVRGLVVLNTAIGPPKKDFRPSAFHRFARLPLVSELAFRGLGFPQIALGMAQGDRASIGPLETAAYIWPLRRLRDRTAPLAMARMVPDSLAHASIPALEASQRFVDGFTGPAAIVWGDRDPVLGRVRTWVEKRLPQARVTCTRAGHFLQEEVPAEIADGIVYVAEALARS
ncbi:MAG: alpha/beta fold hydrolase [Deltaproteobacteria bacterium]|nr:alpha/beta fold hydrolase [Deltaproteobacteria bacterium]